MPRLKTVAVIPVRGGSKGLKKKNIQILAGKPLLAHTIEKVRGCSRVDRIIVSTDAPEVAEVANEFGAETPFFRPKELARDTSKTDEVLQHAVLWLDKKGYDFDAVLWCHVTLPFRKSKWLEHLIFNLESNPDVGSSFIVCAKYKNYWIEKDGEMVPLSLDGTHPGYTQRQRMNPVFQEECGLGCVTRIDIVRNGKRVGPKMMPYKIHEDIATVDIHDEFDLWLANIILQQRPEVLYE